jgi:methionine synthase II (cobalamin-independent)
MFATITGALPSEDSPGAWIGLQIRAGLEPVVDGRDAFGLAPDVDVVDRWRAVAALTDRAVKQALPGPYSLGHRTATAPRDRGATTRAAADRLARDLRRLADAGCPLIEVEEPDAVRIGADEAERRLFREAHRSLLEPVAGAHVSLAIVGGDASAAGAETFFDLPYASYLFDLIAGPDHWRLIARAPRERGIVCGALDARAEADDEPALLVWALHYAASTGGRGPDRVGVANAGSLASLTPDRLERKLRLLGDAARIAAASSVDEIAASLDPRAIDRRTAALGGVRPKPRPRPRIGHQPP